MSTKPQKKPSALSSIKSELKKAEGGTFALLALAGVINAFGVTMFLLPVKLYDSGVSGLSMLLDQITPSYLTLSLFLLVLNIPIFLFGWKRQGTVFTVYSIFAVGVYSLASFLIRRLLPAGAAALSPLAGSDLLLCAIFGGLLSGVGSGLTIRCGGAIDGIDVLSVMFAKKLGISLGSFILIFNTALYIVCGIVIHSWILPLYSIITYSVGAKTVNFIVEGFDRAKCAMIVTTKADEIADALSESFQSGGTIVNAVGGYSKEEKQIVYFIVNHFQINKLKKIVYSIDATAFISLHEITDVIRKRRA